VVFIGSFLKIFSQVWCKVLVQVKCDGCKTVIHQPEVEEAELNPETISPLQKAVIQGFQYRDMLESGNVATVSELAQKVKQERAFLFRALSLVNLAPDIIEAILNGKEPSTLTLSKLRKGFPEDWTKQRKMFGM